MKQTSIHLIDPAQDERWDAFVTRAPNSSIFHHSRWKTVIENSFPARPLYLAMENGADSIEWGMPFFLRKSPITGRALISLPFSDYCDVLTENQEQFGTMWGKALELGAAYGARYIEVRLRAGSEIDAEGFSLKRSATYLNHFLDVGDDLEFIEKKVIEKSYKYDIRQAARSGVTCEAASDEAAMREYYGLYVMTRSRHGLPPVPYTFFRNVWRVLSPAEMVHLFLARWKGQVIAGIIFLRCGNCLYALSNSSDSRFLDKRPNHLLWWRGIQLAVELHIGRLDFGRTSLDNEGLRFFKKRWGTHEVEIHHYRHEMGKAKRDDDNGRGTAVREILPNILKGLPTWSMRIVGDIAYRRLCLW